MSANTTGSQNPRLPGGTIEVDPQAYAEMFHGLRQTSAAIVGVCGRVIRGRAPEEFERLSFTEGRRLAWVLGPSGMHAFIGKSGKEIVLGIGKDSDWLRKKLAEGMTWKLVVVPESECHLADWRGLFVMVQRYYPEVADKVLRWSELLQNSPTASQIDESLVSSEVKDHPDHPNHMSLERYRTCDDTLQNARLFLWHSLGVNEHFKGAGYTRGADGSPGVEEYLMPNRRLAELPGCLLIDLPIF